MNGLQLGSQSAAASSFAQKSCRFTHNKRVPFSALLQPLLRTALNAKPGRVHRVAHDWSTLAFGTHASKRDRKRLTHDLNLGYDLHLAFLVDATDAPLDITSPPPPPSSSPDPPTSPTHLPGTSMNSSRP